MFILSYFILSSVSLTWSPQSFGAHVVHIENYCQPVNTSTQLQEKKTLKLKQL